MAAPKPLEFIGADWLAGCGPDAGRVSTHAVDARPGGLSVDGKRFAGGAVIY